MGCVEIKVSKYIWKNIETMRILKSTKMLLLLLVFLTGCSHQADDWVLKVNEFDISASQFKNKFYQSMDYRDKDKFTVDDLMDYSDRIIINNLLFTVEGYSLEIHLEPDLVNSFKEITTRIIGRKGGPLFKSVIPQNLAKEENEKQIKAYMKKVVKKYNLEIAPQGADLFLTLCQTPRNQVREILFNTSYKPNPNLTKFVSYSTKAFTVADVIKKFSKEFVVKKKKIKELPQVEQYIIEWIMPDLLMLDAEDLGLFEKAELQREILVAERNIVRGECTKRLTIRHIKILPEEVDNRYKQEKLKWDGKSETRAKIQIRKRIRMEKGMARKKATIAELREKYNVEYNTSALNKLTKELSSEKNKAIKENE
jgi:hypothetical protein